MLTGFETKKVIVSAGDAAIRPQAPVNVVDGDGSAVIVGRAEAGVNDTVADPTGRRRHARRGVAELIDVVLRKSCWVAGHVLLVGFSFS